MEKRQKEFYLEALGTALKLAGGQRDQDYNKGGIDLRDYWEVNGIRGALQMVDMKVKRALSQVGSWSVDKQGRPEKPSKEQVAAILESMADAINYAAFTFGEAAALYEDDEDGHVELAEGEWLAKAIKSYDPAKEKPDAKQD